MISNTYVILPSEKGAERRRREIFAQSKETVWVGETIFSLPHFLKTITRPQKPLLKRNSQRHLIAHCLKNTPLRYFEKLKHSPSLSKPFLEAIRELKRSLLTPDKLENTLQESGTLREYDLLITWRAYEKLKEELGMIDEEDLYCLPMAVVPEGKIIFEDFVEQPPALQQLAQKLKAQVRTIPEIAPETLTNVRLYSLPTPFQETNWFLSKLNSLFEEGISPSQMAILVGTPNNYYEAIWQKLNNVSLAQETSPNLVWRALSPGRLALKKGASLALEEAPLEEWLDNLLPALEKEEELYSFLDRLRFQDTLFSFGTLTKSEWLSWLKEALEEKPELKINAELSALQWLENSEADFPNLKYLWVPGLIEGQFPSLPPITFFQDKKERNILFERKRRAFLYQLSKTQTEVWLTFPRLDSLGQDVAPSPFTWDFERRDVFDPVVPITTTPPSDSFSTSLAIEKERMQNQLETKPFHAVLEDKEWRNKILPTQETHIFSPSQLETYAQCPFKYYAWRVLSIPRRKEYAPEVDPDDKGTLFHDCLEKFLKENGALLDAVRKEPKREEELFSILEKTVASVFEKKAAELSYANPELYKHLKEKTFHQAKQLMTNELVEARSLEAPLKPTFFEWSFGDDTQKPFELGEIKIGGRIDRIDIDEAGRHFLILDYKTGSISKFKERRLQGLALQLPLYILAVRNLLLPKQEAIGALLIQAKTGEKKIGLVDSHFNETHFFLNKRSQSLFNTQELEEAIQEIVKWVETYVQQIRSGYFSAQPKECKPSCDYKEICRYAHKPLD